MGTHTDDKNRASGVRMRVYYMGRSVWLSLDPEIELSWFRWAEQPGDTVGLRVSG